MLLSWLVDPPRSSMERMFGLQTMVKDGYSKSYDSAISYVVIQKYVFK